MELFTKGSAALKHSKRFPKYYLPLPLTLLAAVLLAGCITLLALWCQPNALRVVLLHMKAQPLLIVLNAMPAGLLVLLFTCLFRNVFFSAALVNLILFICFQCNRVGRDALTELQNRGYFWSDLNYLSEQNKTAHMLLIHVKKFEFVSIFCCSSIII